MTQPTNKVCTKCHQEKPLSEFRWLRTHNRYQAQCKQCEREYAHAYQSEIATGKRRVYALTHRLKNMGVITALEFIHKQKELIMSHINTLQSNIEQWAVDRNLHTGNPVRQTLKLVEELGELAAAIARNNQDEIKDAIGDITVVTIILNKQLGYKTSLEYIINDHTKYEKSVSYKEQVQPQFFADLVNAVNSITCNVAYTHRDSNEIYKVIHAAISMAKSLGVDYIEAVEAAYDVIKDRKGKLVNGVFIKEDE